MPTAVKYRQFRITPVNLQPAAAEAASAAVAALALTQVGGGGGPGSSGFGGVGVGAGEGGSGDGGARRAEALPQALAAALRTPCIWAHFQLTGSP